MKARVVRDQAQSGNLSDEERRKNAADVLSQVRRVAYSIIHSTI